MKLDYTDCPKDVVDFLNYLYVIKNYSEQTIMAYKFDLLMFFNFIIKYQNLNIEVEQMNMLLIKNIKSTDIIAFMVHLNYNKNYKANSRNRKLNCIRSFFNWASKKYNFVVNPTKNLEQLKIPKKLPKYLNIEQSKKILDIFNLYTSRHSSRDNLIIKLFIFTGARLSELSNIDIENIDFINKLILITGKGSKERVLYLNSNICEELEMYIKTLKKDNSKHNALFRSQKGNRLCTRQIERICKKAFKLAGLEEYDFTAHSLRHSFATLLYQNNVDILSIKEALGHENVTTTDIYSHTSNSQIQVTLENNPFNILKGA